MLKKNSEITVRKEMENLLEQGISKGVFPCAAAGVSWGLGKERKVVISYCGKRACYPEKRKLKKNNYFDLASLTKPLATTLAILCLIKNKKIELDENLSSLLEKKVKGEKSKITIKNILSHSSGLPAHREYFTLLKDVPVNKRGGFVENLILQEEHVYIPGTANIYSDLGFILLGRIIEKKSGIALSRFVEERVLQSLNLEEKIFFNPLYERNKRHKKIEFVATENCPWRKKILCGEVHDDNCYSLGGVAGHSGLFGTIEGVTTYVGLILDMWKGAVKHPNIDKKDLQRILTRQNKIKKSTWALGFDTPAETDSSSGKYLSKTSVGHLGFTGTSFWIDPLKNIVIVLLSNRVHPSRENIKIRKFRPYFHDQIIKELFP